jgi:hypothetical protein
MFQERVRQTRKAIVTATALVLMPGVVIVLTAEEAQERKHAVQAAVVDGAGNGTYKVTAENHFKNGQVVEFAGEVPKQYASSVTTVGADGRPLPSTTAGAGAAEAKAPAAFHGSAVPNAPSGERALGLAGGAHEKSEPEHLSKAELKEELAELDGMTKAELIEYAEQHHVQVDANMNKSQLVAAISKRLKAA